MQNFTLSKNLTVINQHKNNNFFYVHPSLWLNASHETSFANRALPECSAANKVPYKVISLDEETKIAFYD